MKIKMQQLNAIIVDDEPNARLLLHEFLVAHCPEVTIVAEAEDVKSAVKIINNNKIDLVFLDVEMPNENGFTLFEYFEKTSFETIFCTAYAEYAVKAFEVSAVDYILKPIGIAKLQEAVAKAQRSRLVNENYQKIEALKENLHSKKIKKIAVYIGDGLVFFNPNDIFYFEADGAYTNIYHKNGKNLSVKPLKHFEEMLSSDNRFFRIHRSYFVNVEQIKKYSKKDGFSITYDDKTLLPISREKKEEFEELMHLNNNL